MKLLYLTVGPACRSFISNCLLINSYLPVVREKRYPFLCIQPKGNWIRWCSITLVLIFLVRLSKFDIYSWWVRCAASSFTFSIKKFHQRYRQSERNWRICPSMRLPYDRYTQRILAVIYMSPTCCCWRFFILLFTWDTFLFALLEDVFVFQHRKPIASNGTVAMLFHCERRYKVFNIQAMGANTTVMMSTEWVKIEAHILISTVVMAPLSVFFWKL